MNNKGKLYIGTSNVVIPGNKSTFPLPFQSKSRLSYYGSLFNSVEINSSFYKTPLPKTYRRWTQETPEDFRFSIKLSKEITHAKELQYDGTVIENFMTAARGIENKKGCLLIQFPGKITFDYFKHVTFVFEEIKKHDPANEWNKAVEFRNADWYTGETRELLHEYNMSMVLHDHPKAKISEVTGNPPFIYMRFHGPKGDYRNSYTESFLNSKAEQIKEWLISGIDVYAYFNNTIGSAFANAQILKKISAQLL